MIHAADLANQVAAMREEIGAPALAALVMADGKVHASAAIGRRAVGRSAPVTATDRWHLGSIGKSMTATLVARLVERDVVSWNDTVGDVLGRSIPDMRTAYRAASFRHLLSHRSGLQKDLPLTQDPDFAQNPADPIADRRRWVRLALTQEPIGPPEVTFEYSNNGYVVAAAMLEARTGKSWETLIRDSVFVPLGLKSAGFGPPGTEGADDAPRGHRRVSRKLQAMGLDADNPAAAGPAGRIHMSLADLVRYADMHRRRDVAFLSAEGFETLHTPPYGGDYAMGWVRLADGSMWHAGSNTMWYAVVNFWPKFNIAGAVAANLGDLAVLGQFLYDLLSAFGKAKHREDSFNSDLPP